MDGRTKTAKLQNKPLEYALTLEMDRVIEMVNGTMAIDGIPLTDEDRSRLRIIMRGEATADEIVRQLVVKHGRKRMSGGKVFLDTNVFVYMYDASEPKKKGKPRERLTPFYAL